VSKIELEPQAATIIARLIDMQRTESGIIMPDTQIKGVTVFALVETIGPDVKRCKPGDIVLPRSVEHCWLRGGTFHRALIQDDQVVAIVKGGFDRERMKFVDERIAAGDDGKSRLAT
jgi:hypothetical protein